MAARPGRPVFICQNCGYQAPKWLGRCPDCGAWSSMAEEITPSAPVPEVQLPPRRRAPQPLIHLQAPPEVRQVSGLTEFDRTLGGSVVHGSVVLLGGDPGIGKSTLMLQVLDKLCRRGDKGLYISGEESETQIKLRSDRLGLTSPGLLVATETCLENILKILEEHKPAFLALDSVQTLYTATLPAAPGQIPFTPRARKVLEFSHEEALALNHDYIGTEHILLGLVREGEGVAAAVLQKLGLSPEKIRLEVEKLVQSGPSTMVSGDIPFTPKAKKVIELAMEEARSLGHNYIGTEHLLLGLIREGEGVASQVFMNMGLDLEKVREEVIKLLGSTTPGQSAGGPPPGGGRLARRHDPRGLRARLGGRACPGAEQGGKLHLLPVLNH